METATITSKELDAMTDEAKHIQFESMSKSDLYRFAHSEEGMRATSRVIYSMLLHVTARLYNPSHFQAIVSREQAEREATQAFLESEVLD